MTSFSGYARYYDLLYRDKNYRGETEFVNNLIRQHAPNARKVLELGCGTGIHGVMLAEQGYDVTGLDLSEEMLATAAQRVAGLPESVSPRVRFFHGDIRDFRAPGSFDAVLALFHVMSYQLTNEDLRAVFANVKSHLAPGGIFIFDCWYGPAVLTDRPVVREKQFSDDTVSVARTAVPTLHPGLNRVDVQYRIVIRDKRRDTVEELSELHRVRYLFRPELELLADAAGLRIESCGEWMSGREPDFSTWYVYFTLRHRDR